MLREQEGPRAKAYGPSDLSEPWLASTNAYCRKHFLKILCLFEGNLQLQDVQNFYFFSLCIFWYESIELYGKTNFAFKNGLTYIQD